MTTTSLRSTNAVAPFALALLMTAPADGQTKHGDWPASNRTLTSERLSPLSDLWAHAHYLDYKNERDRFLRAWFDQLANWDFAAAQHAAALDGGAGYRYPLADNIKGHAAARR